MLQSIKNALCGQTEIFADVQVGGKYVDHRDLKWVEVQQVWPRLTFERFRTRINYNVYQELKWWWWRSRLRHFSTSREVAGSIHDGVIGIFH